MSQIIKDNYIDPKVDKILGFEDAMPELIEKVITETGDLFGKHDKEVNILIVRDIYNLTASRIKHWDLMSSEEKFIYIRSAAKPVYWQWYANQLNKHWEERTTPEKLFISVNFNEFSVNNTYRDKFVDKLSKFIGDVDKEKAESKIKTPNKNGESDFSDENRDKRFMSFSHILEFLNLFTEEDHELNERSFGIERIEQSEPTESKARTLIGIPEVTNESPDYVIFNTGSGGIGKIIQSTAVAQSIYNQYTNAEIHIITPHVAVYDNCPFATMHQMGRELGLYDELNKKGNVLYLRAEPYNHPDYINGTKHIIDCWNEMLNLNYPTTKTKIWLTESEKTNGKRIIETTKNPVCLLHTQGGVIKKGQPMETWYRTLPSKTAQAIVDTLRGKYGFMQILRDGQYMLNNVVHAKDQDLRTLFSIIYAAHVIVSIDTFTQHAAKALGKKAIVLWGSTRPQCLGYQSHVNLWRNSCNTPLCNRPNSYIGDFTADGRPWICPYGHTCIQHDPINIIAAIEEM
jgi:hypothetical protein